MKYILKCYNCRYLAKKMFCIKTVPNGMELIKFITKINTFHIFTCVLCSLVSQQVIL